MSTATKRQRAEIRFHSFYMRWEVVQGRKVVAMYVCEGDAMEHAYRLNYPPIDAHGRIPLGR